VFIAGVALVTESTVADEARPIMRSAHKCIK